MAKSPAYPKTETEIESEAKRERKRKRVCSHKNLQKFKRRVIWLEKECPKILPVLDDLSKISFHTSSRVQTYLGVVGETETMARGFDNSGGFGGISFMSSVYSDYSSRLSRCKAQGKRMSDIIQNAAKAGRVEKPPWVANPKPKKISEKPKPKPKPEPEPEEDLADNPFRFVDV